MKNSTKTGQEAEHNAAVYLEGLGYQIVELNWKRVDCEIDIVARQRKEKHYVFFEVKYRQSSDQGFGLEYITKEKLRQMKYAARRYVNAHDINDGYQLGAVEVEGPDYRVKEVLESIID